MNAKEYCQRLIDSHRERIMTKESSFLTQTQGQLYEIIVQIAENKNSKILRHTEIKKEFEKKFGKTMNLLPSDFCYNKVNVWPDFEVKFLLSYYYEKGRFKYVGCNWINDVVEKITWAPQGKHVPLELRGNIFNVGIYQRGRYKWDFSELNEFL